jgi:hypothetical protein
LRQGVRDIGHAEQDSQRSSAMSGTPTVTPLRPTEAPHALSLRRDNAKA